MRVERLRVVHPSGGPVLVKRGEQDSTDVNLIMDSWVHAGAAVAGHMNTNPGSYGDFSSGMDYHSAMNAVKEAQAYFMCLPPKVRDHVENDPGKLLDLVYDPERRSELEELGLVAPKVPVLPEEKPKVVTEPEVKVLASDDAEKARGGSQKSADPAAGLFD